MNPKDQTLLHTKLKSNHELKQLWGEHLNFEKMLEKIDRKLFLSPQEKLEKKRIQLAKLVGKTRIETILSKYRAL